MKKHGPQSTDLNQFERNSPVVDAREALKAQGAVRDHFDQVAHEYDYWKKRNWYYYAQLKALLSELIPPGKNILEIGCATGDLLVHLRPARGLGIDISPKMIQRAQQKHQTATSVEFLHVSALEELPSSEFDYILMADVVEHLRDVPGTLREIHRIATPRTSLVMTMANPLWQPLLLLLEKLRLKMPEGPHHRLPLRAVRALLRAEGFVLQREGKRVLVPARIPWLSDAVNAHFYHVPGLQNLGLIAWFVATKGGITA